MFEQPIEKNDKKTEVPLTPENKGDDRQELIEALKKGEGKELLNKWLLKEEGKVKESANPSLEAINLNLKRARLYYEAGFMEEAFENFEDARRQAHNEGRDDLYNLIMNEMDEKEM